MKDFHERLMDITAKKHAEMIFEKGMNMKTTGRNEPCPCGSGRKYKKCCLLKRRKESAAAMTENEKPELKNEFRNEAKNMKISPEEMTKRNRYVMMRQLQVKKILVDSDRQHLEKSAELLQMFKDELTRLLYSEGREAVLKSLEPQIEGLNKQIAVTRLDGHTKIMLELLEEVLPTKTTAPDREVPLEDEL